MPKIIIDEIEYEVKDKKNLLDACLSLKLDLPYFCWHPAMNSVGACRQCAVTKYKDKNDTKGKLVMACMEPVQDGMRISMKDSESVEFRSHIIEWLMTNHPHDCPVCDEGGECHLQDMTVMTGHSYRQFRFNKRTYNNQYLGPFINHEMNRCIQCYRCVRFYRDYADGRDFNVFASKNHIYFGRSEDGILENEFSGNLIEVCPTGVFTDKTLKQHFTRKWDYTSAPSICHNCGVGCNIIASERYDSLRRIRSRYNSKVNGYFICDRGRFGYEWVNDKKRILQPLIKSIEDNRQKIADRKTIIEKTGKLISSTKTIGIGSSRASLESNYTLRKLVGKENFYSSFNTVENKLYQTSLNILRKGIVRTPSLKEVEEFDTVFILGEDVTNTAPMLALSIRQAIKLKPKEIAADLNIPLWHDSAVREAVQDEKGPLYIASVSKTRLEDISKKVIHSSPDDIARIGFAVANIIDNNSPTVSNLSDDEKEFAKNVAEDLMSSDKPLIITGSGCMNEDIIKASYNISLALHRKNNRAEIVITSSAVNSLGLAMMEAESLDSAFNGIDKGEIETLIILESDLFRNNSKEKIKNVFDKVKNIIVIDSIENETTLAADYVIPAGTFAESDGTVVNNEGRAQRFYQCFQPKEDVFESWRYLTLISIAAGRKDFTALNHFDDYVKSLIIEMPQFDGVQNTAPPSDFRKAGQKIPRESHRFSGRTAMNADKNVSEPKPPVDDDSPLSFTMEGFRGQPPSSITPFYWSPGWNSVQSINKYQIEIAGPLHDGDPGIRLIEPNENSITQLSFFKDVPKKFIFKADEYFLVPLYHIYGSEELSSKSPAIKERIPEIYIAINQKESERLGVKEKENPEIIIDDKKLGLQVKILNELPDGIAGYPVYLPGILFIDLSSFHKIKKEVK